MNLTMERMAAVTDEVRQLLAELDVALAGNYLPEQRHALSVEQLFGGNVRFFVARVDGIAVGCGGVAFYDGYAEVKRMYTRPTARRMGVATGVLRHLEGEARGAGHTILRLGPAGIRPKPSACICARASSDAMPSATTRAWPRTQSRRASSARRRSEPA